MDQAPTKRVAAAVRRTVIQPDRWVAILFISLAGLIAFDARRLQVYPVGAGTFLALVAVGMVACGIALWFESETIGSDPESAPARSWANPCYVAVVISLYLGTIFYVGYLIATTGLVIAMLLRLANYRILVTVLWGLVIAGVSFGIFKLLGTSLPSSWLESLLHF